MPLPKEVTDVQVKDTYEFDKRGNPIAVMVYTYFIGGHGPFTSKFNAGEQDTPHIERVISDRVAALRTQGVLG
jgi:hypothetical protein